VRHRRERGGGEEGRRKSFSFPFSIGKTAFAESPYNFPSEKWGEKRKKGKGIKGRLFTDILSVPYIPGPMIAGKKEGKVEGKRRIIYTPPVAHSLSPKVATMPKRGKEGGEGKGNWFLPSRLQGEQFIFCSFRANIQREREEEKKGRNRSVYACGRYLFL